MTEQQVVDAILYVTLVVTVLTIMIVAWNLSK